MKHRPIAVLLAAALLALTFILPVSAAPEPALSIRLSSDAGETEQTAAAILQDCLEDCTGARPALISAEETAEQVIALNLTQKDSPQKKGSYVLRAGYNEDQKLGGFEPGVFYIDASDPRGLFNGVYGFLREVLGIEIYAAGVKSAPESAGVVLPERYWFAYEPTLEYADTDWISPHDVEFALANGLNGTYSPLEPVHGGKVHYLWFCHSLTNGIVPESELFETHPEYFSLTERSGEREPRQLCLSNPDVVKRAIEDVRAQLEANYDPEAALNIVSVTQDDNQDYCVCENCTAIAEQYGGQSGLMLWFVNQIAEAVEPDYPDAVIDTFAYQYTRRAPQGIRPRDNVCVRLCSIECCFSHALADPDCSRNAEFMKDLQDWSAICNRLYVWDYVTNFVQTIGIFPNFGVLRENIDTFRANNVVGIYEEGNYYAGDCNAEFADLRAYLLSCLMRDELTAEEEAEKRDGFLKAYYGEGAAEIGEFLDFITEHAGDEDGHLGIYYSMGSTLHDVTQADMKRMDALWDTAIEKAREAGNEPAVERLERSRLSWRYYEACVVGGELATILPGVPDPKRMSDLIADLSAFGVTRYNEGRTMEQVYPSPFFSPDRWETPHQWLYPMAVCCAAVVILLAVVAAVILMRKKHVVFGILMLAVSAVSVVSGTWASILFIRWDQLLLYAVVDAVMLLSVAFFCYAAAWARNGCAHPTGKRLVLTVISVLAVAAAPYEVGVLLINTIILKSVQPTFAITLSALIQIAVIGISLILFFAALRRNAKQKEA